VTEPVIGLIVGVCLCVWLVYTIIRPKRHSGRVGRGLQRHALGASRHTQSRSNRQAAAFVGTAPSKKYDDEH
jgi:hypothetical protein